MKKIYILIFCLMVGSLQAQESGEFFGEDFANQSVILVQNKQGAKQCQAVRILPTWYLTAAHCVRPYCDKECKVTVQLLQGDLQASATLWHTQSLPQVFVPAAYHPGDGKSIRSDIALIHFRPAEEDYIFYEARNNTALDKAVFMEQLNSSAHNDQRNQWQQLQKARPKLLTVTNSVNRKLSYPLAVPDLRGEGIYFKQSQGNFYYFTSLHHYIGPNFGIEKGMSGSGVILPGGAVAGVVSASLSSQNQITVYNEKDEAVKSVPYSSNYFLFTPLSPDNIAFIRATVNSFREDGRGPNVVGIHGHYSQPAAAKLSEVFPEFSAAEDVLSVRAED